MAVMKRTFEEICQEEFDNLDRPGGYPDCEICPYSNMIYERSEHFGQVKIDKFVECICEDPCECAVAERNANKHLKDMAEEESE